MRKRGIPHRLWHGSFRVRHDDDKEAKANWAAVSAAGTPQVYIDGMAKGNPSVEDVVAEYERTRGRARTRP